MLAVEMRTPPTFCNFQPLLAQNPPALCTTGSAMQIFKDNFDSGGSFTDRWTVSHEGTTPDFTERDWSVVGDLPDDRAGKAMFGPNPDIGTCAPADDETAVLHADSKQISIPNGVNESAPHVRPLGGDGGRMGRRQRQDQRQRRRRGTLIPARRTSSTTRTTPRFRRRRRGTPTRSPVSGHSPGRTAERWTAPGDGRSST